MFTDRQSMIIFMTIVVILPLTLLRKLDGLMYTSLMGLAGTVFCAVFMTIRYMDGSYGPGGSFYNMIEPEHRPQFGNRITINHQVFRLIATGSSAFQAHYNAPKMWTELKHPTLARYDKVVSVSFLFAALISIYIMVVGYLTFGGNSAGLILNNYSVADPIAAIARIAVGLGIVFGYPLSFTALREGVWDLTSVVTPEEKERQHVPTSLILLALLTGCALVVHNVSVVISLRGALFGTMLIYIFPAVMNLSIIERTFPSSKKFGTAGMGIMLPQYGLIVAGVAVAVIGTLLNIEKLL
jgi:amino acid permease